MIMLSALHSESVEGVGWLEPFVQDFKVRFTTLLAGAYRSFPPALALSILDPKLTFSDAESQQAGTQELALHKADGSSLTPYDFKRLQVCPLPRNCTKAAPRSRFSCIYNHFQPAGPTLASTRTSFAFQRTGSHMCGSFHGRHLISNRLIKS